MAIDVSGGKIIYGKKPRQIQILNTKTIKCQCDNCANVGHIYKLLYNKTDFRTPAGNIGKRQYAKDKEIWLCDECVEQLKKSILEVK